MVRGVGTEPGLVLAVEDGQPMPRASWSGDGTLVITLAHDEPYLYSVKSFRDVSVVLLREGPG
jgi:hypothetical protein